MATNDLIAALQGVGRVDSEGSFSFDREKAREKLRTFQVAEPQRYVLHFVAFAVLKGATRIEIQCDSDDLIVRFDGAPVTALDLEDLYNASFAAAESDEQRARQQLAVGLHAALALNPRHVRLTSGVGEAAVELLARHDRPDEIEKPKNTVGVTKIHVEQRFRPGLMVRFVRHLRGGLAEAAWLRARACHASVAIVLNGETISAGLQIAGARHQAGASDGHCHGAGGLVDGPADSPAGGVVRLVRHGVWLCDEPLPWAPAGFVAVVSNGCLLTDLSGDKVVLDGEHARCLALAERLAELVVVAAVGPGVTEGWLPGLRERLVEVWLRWPAALDPATAVGEAMGRMLVWRDMWHRSHSLAALRAQVARTGHLPTTTVEFNLLLTPGEDAVMFRGDAHTNAVLDRVFGEACRDVTAALELQARAEANRRRWHLQPSEPTLTAANYLLVAPLTLQVGEHTFHGQVGLRRAPGKTCGMLVIVDGCVLTGLELDAPIAGIDAVIAGPLPISADFSGPVLGELFASCLGAWLTAARALAEAAFAVYREPWPESAALTELRHGLLRAYHPVDAVAALLKDAGYTGDSLVAHSQLLVAALASEPVPEDLSERTWARGLQFLTASDRHIRADALAEALRSGVPVHWVPATYEAHPLIAEPVLRVGAQSAQALRWLFGDRVPRMPAGKYDDLLGEAKLLAKPQRPLALPADSHTDSVLAEQDGLHVALAFPRARAAWARWDQRAACDVLRAGRLLTQVNVWSPVPGASFAIAGDHLRLGPRREAIVHDDMFQESMVKLVAAVPTLISRALARITAASGATEVDEAWRRGLLAALTASLPGKHFRAAYGHLLAKKGRAIAEKTQLKLLALAANCSTKAVSDAIAPHTREHGVLLDIKQIAAGVSAPPPDQNSIANVAAVLQQLRALFGQTGGASWLDDVATFSPAVGALPLLQRIDGTPVTLAEARAEAFGDGLYIHAIESDARPDKFLRSLRADSFTHEALVALFGEQRLRRGERSDDRPAPAPAKAKAKPQPEPAPTPARKPRKPKKRPAEPAQAPPPSPPAPADTLAELQRAADARAAATKPEQPVITIVEQPQSVTAAAPTQPPQGPTVPPPPNPGERLIAAVQAELQALRRGHESLLTGFNLDHVRAVQGDGQAMVGIVADGVVVDVAHPLVQRAIAEHADDHLWVSFLASRVYTALNVWREDITDVDEAKFHARHLAWLHAELGAWQR